MIETHEFRGFWWLPGNEEEKLSGTLTVTKGDAVLDVLGHFGHKRVSDVGGQKTYSFELEEQPRIHGIGTTGEEITLERHGRASWSAHFPGIETAVDEPEVVLIGKLFAPDMEVGFDEIAIEASDLNTWTSVSGFEAKICGHEEPESGHFIATTTDIHLRPPTTSRSRSTTGRRRGSASELQALASGEEPPTSTSRRRRPFIFASRSGRSSTRSSSVLVSSGTSLASPSVVPSRS